MARKKDDNGIGHNGAPSREDMQRAFLVHLEAIRAQEAALVTAMEGMRAIRKLRTQVRNAAKRDLTNAMPGFTLDDIDGILHDEGLSKVNIAAREESRFFMRETAGLPNGGKQDLFLSLEEQPAHGPEFWLEDGYHAGLIGRPLTTPAGCPPEHHQVWAKGWHDGEDKRSWALSDAGKNPEKADGKAGGGPTAAEIARQPEEADA